MSRNKTSSVWRMPNEDFEKLVLNSKSYTDVLKYFGLENKGNNSRVVKRRIVESGISCDHFMKRGEWSLGHSKSLEELLVENSTAHRTGIKRRLIQAGLLKNVCYVCGLESIWQNKTLVLVLDHINGVSNDYRIDNLRLLCPNCNSQTDTFSGKNISNKRVTNTCIECGKLISRASKRCTGCYSRSSGGSRRKVKNRPSIEQLKSDVLELGFRGAGRKYGVSDNSIRKWLKIL